MLTTNQQHEQCPFVSVVARLATGICHSYNERPRAITASTDESFRISGCGAITSLYPNYCRRRVTLTDFMHYQCFCNAVQNLNGLHHYQRTNSLSSLIQTLKLNLLSAVRRYKGYRCQRGRPQITGNIYLWMQIELPSLFSNKWPYYPKLNKVLCGIASRLDHICAV